MLSREREKATHFTTESETECESEDTESSIDSCAIDKLDKTEILQSKNKRGVVRIDSKPTVHVGGPMPVRVMNNTYKMPAYYYSLPKYEWNQFYFLEPIKPSLKPEPIVINPLTAKQKPSSKQRRNAGTFRRHSPEKLRLPPIEKMPRPFSRPSQEPPTWQEIIGSQFPINPPMSRLMSTKSPKKLLMPLATSLAQPPLPTEILRLPEESQSKHTEKPLKPKLRLPESCIKVTKGMPMEIGDPTKMEKHARVLLEDNGLPIIYHEKYNLKVLPYSMDRFQPMIPDKADRVYSLLKSGCLEDYEVVKWTGIDISSVYDINYYVPEFIREVKIKWISHVMQLNMLTSMISSDQFDSAILRPLRVQTMGSVVACQLAMEEGWAINIGGGFGHYSINVANAGGLGLYDDVLLCLAIMSRSSRVKKILVVNVDAYQCLSYEDVSRRSIRCPVTIIDVYSRENQWKIYDTPKKSGSLQCISPVNYIGCKLWTNNTIIRLHQEMDRVFKEAASLLPSLCIYVAGTYALQENRCTPFCLTSEEVIKRDEEVFELIYKTYKIPTAILLGGGYHPCDVEVAAASLANLCRIGIPLLWRLHDQESQLVHGKKLKCKASNSTASHSVLFQHLIDH